jgi:hypothetical protein
MSSVLLRQAFRRGRDSRINDSPIGRSRGVAYIQPWQEQTTQSGSPSLDEPPAKEVTMKVQTDVKAGSGFSGFGITAVVIVDVDVNLGCGCGCRQQPRC